MVSVRALVLAVVIVLLIMAIAPRVRAGETTLTGFWAGDPAFLDQAGLSAFYLYIAPPEKRWLGGATVRPAYVTIMGADGAPLVDQAIELKYGGSRRWGAATCDCLSTAAGYRVPNVGVTPSPGLPDYLDFWVDAPRGSLALTAGGVLWAHLLKDNESSAAAEAEYSAAATAAATDAADVLNQ